MQSAEIIPLYVTEKDTARLLGHGIDWFRKNVETLERQYGLPAVDPATGKRHRPSIEAWADERNRRHQAIQIGQNTETATIGNYNEF